MRERTSGKCMGSVMGKGVDDLSARCRDSVASCEGAVGRLGNWGLVCSALVASASGRALSAGQSFSPAGRQGDCDMSDKLMVEVRHEAEQN